MPPKYPFTLSSLDTAIVDLRPPRVCVHLRELELGLGAHALGEKGVGDHVAECLSGMRR